MLKRRKKEHALISGEIFVNRPQQKPTGVKLANNFNFTSKRFLITILVKSIILPALNVSFNLSSSCKSFSSLRRVTLFDERSVNVDRNSVNPKIIKQPDLIPFQSAMLAVQINIWGCSSMVALFIAVFFLSCR